MFIGSSPSGQPAHDRSSPRRRTFGAVGPIVVGVRGCESLPTLAWAADQAAATDRQVVAVHVMAPAYDIGDMPIGSVSLADDYAHLTGVLAREWTHVLRVRGVCHSAEVVVGGVLPSLCAVARRERASMLVLGAPKPRLLVAGLGRFVSAAPCSVAFVSSAVPLDLADDGAARPSRARRSPLRLGG